MYISHLTTGRRGLASAGQAAPAPKRRGPKGDIAKAETRRVEVLGREVMRLGQKPEHAEHIIAAQKK